VPNIVSKAAQAIDPNVRETRPSTSGITSLPERIGKTIESRIPFASKNLAARRSGTGEPIARQGNAATRFASPVQPSTENEGAPFQELLVDLDAVPGAPRKEITLKTRRGKKAVVRLTDAEYAALQAEDEETTKRLRRATRAAGFMGMDEESQRNYVRGEYEKGRTRARARLLASSALRTRANAAP
jgi:PHD/YefM family antitoxin component YafN of YafNO toxin-antitoxin module